MTQPSGPGNNLSRASIAIAAFSTIVEWYDFTLYLYFSTVLSRVFFGGGQTGLLATLAGFAIAYFLRPLGATSATAIFGGLTPFIAQMATDRTGWAAIPGAMIGLVALCVLPLLIKLPQASNIRAANRPMAGRL